MVANVGGILLEYCGRHHSFSHSMASHNKMVGVVRRLDCLNLRRELLDIDRLRSVSGVASFRLVVEWVCSAGALFTNCQTLI